MQPGFGPISSRLAVALGGAVAGAAARLADKLARAAAVMLEVAPEDVELFDAQLRVRGAPDRAVGLAQVVMFMTSRPDRLPEGVDGNPEATYVWNPPPNHQLADEQGRAHYSITASGAVHLCMLEIDRDTGKVDILKYAVVDDCGVRMNPSVVRGMIHGGLAQGIGCALLEEFVYDDNGQLLTSTYMDYVMPSIMEMPRELHEFDMCTPSPVTALGVKGIGEAAIHTTPAAVLCAVNDALAALGVSVTESPATPVRIWKAIHGATR
jgi:CO/xanthine dehydrogenase Mo-binding subunit